MIRFLVKLSYPLYWLLIRVLLVTAILNAALLMATIAKAAELPELGMAGATVLSLAQEQQLAEQQKLLLRRQFNFIEDPLLNTYLNRLGQQLVQKTSFPSPFHFYLIRDTHVNAFATFGGNIYFYSGLLQLTQTESQLASVMAHEISHVTQRHLASYLEKRQASTPLTLLGTASSILLSLLHPDAGMALLSSTIAGDVQQQLSFTQQHEREADTLGLALLVSNGFEPQGMTEFMELLAAQNRFNQAPPEMLLTHPLPNTRIAYAKNRISQLLPQNKPSSLDYYLAKVRLTILLEESNQRNTAHDTSTQLLNQYKVGTPAQQRAAQYAAALRALQLKHMPQAQQLSNKLLQGDPANIWFLDLATDIDLELKQPQQAIKRLIQALEHSPQQTVLQLNLINAYIAAENYSAASNLLHRYTHAHPDDLNGWSLTIELYGKTAQLAERYAALAQLVARQGDLERAAKLLITASSHATMGSHTQARIDAQLDRLRQLQQNLAK